ncbi:MAG: hypothetical protein GX442_09845, partial [Candidatus Riflebacteria bacterium]|nr:hypothetical protein [Candidatus Riflebacteria bacterium]
ATGGGTALASFTVYDFGSDIRNGTSDDQAYTFFVQPSEIVFLSADAAVVPSWIDFSNGTRYQLTINVVRIEGQWFVDDLEFEVIGSGYYTGPVPSTALFPMSKDDRLNAVRLPAAGGVTGATTATPTTDFVLTSIGGTPETNTDGQEVFTLDRQEYSGPLPVSTANLGAATSSLVFGSSPLTSSRIQASLIARPRAAPAGLVLGEIARLLDAGGLGRLRFSNTYGLLAFGAGTGFNDGKPWRLTNQVARDGDTLAQTVTFLDADGARRRADLRSQFIGRVPVTLPWGTKDGIRLDLQASLPDTGEVIQESWILVPGVGLVNVVSYDETTGKPTGQLCLLAAQVANQSFGNPAALPAAGVVLTVAVTARRPTPWWDRRSAIPSPPPAARPRTRGR